MLPKYKEKNNIRNNVTQHFHKITFVNIERTEKYERKDNRYLNTEEKKNIK